MSLVKSYPDYSKYNEQHEANLLKQFVEGSNYYIDSEFYNKIEKGDIIEIYTFPENTQLYANSEFKNLCSYSEEQLKTIPFTKLFWRESDVHIEIVRRAATICEKERKICRWDLPNHDLVESMHPRRRTFSMVQKWLAPCYDKNRDKVVGFVSTCCVEFIYELPED